MYDNKFLPKLSQNFLEILEDNEFYDITIEVGDDPYVKIFHAHMVILNCRSPYLQRILSTNVKKNDRILAHVKLPNISPEIFQMVLRYIYGGSLSLEEYDTLDIIKILVASNELKNCLISLIQHDNFKMNVIQVWENVLKWGIAQNPELPSDPLSYSKDDFITLRNTLQKFIPFINFFNLTSKEYLDKVYPYKKIIPKDMRENLLRHFMDQPNSNPEPNITKEIDSMAISSTQKNLLIEKDFNMIVDGINDLIYELLNKGIDSRILIKQKVIEHFNNHNVDAQETYNWLLNNQISINSIFLLGYFNYYGIETSLNYEKAFNLFISASEKNHTLAQFFLGNCYRFGHGTIKIGKLAFEYYEKAANNNLSHGQTSIGYCYKNGACVKKDLIMAFYWYEKAAKNGNITAISNLGHCYDNGIGITVDKQKAFELYQNAANLGNKVAQYNLALMYEKGDGIIKDIDKAIYWYEKSAKQGYKDAQNELKYFKKIQ
ncbi:kinase-like domain-containing protein [Rhizophagus clarus]|uniref:Kinase-like domain-containing protein n=1 Tax=Rhizophagus clarus TaxID=94130 RepID=A0A8H3M4E8_9GLOM|nr:kinase-like domain-containing protein [Rhizophagus clarus]